MRRVITFLMFLFQNWSGAGIISELWSRSKDGFLINVQTTILLRCLLDWALATWRSTLGSMAWSRVSPCGDPHC